MPVTIELPHVGESVVEGTIGKWLKQPGDTIRRFEPLVEVVTDKVTMEVPSPVSGSLLRILAEEGETVPMGAPIAEMDSPDAPTATAPSPALEPVPGEFQRPPAPAQPSGPAATAYLRRDIGPVGPTGGGMADPAALDADPQQPAPAPARDAGGTGSPGGPGPAGGPGNAPGDVALTGAGNGRAPRHSPAVRRLAQEHNIDLNLLTGTGMGGRITRDDVLKYIASPPQAAPEAPPTQAAPQPAPAPALAADEERLALTPVRRAIAEAMTRSATQIPHAWTMIEVDVTGLVDLRNRARSEFQDREGVELTYLPFAIKAVVESLKENPTLNASWGGDHIVLKNRINIGIAAAAPTGLVVPVIHDADRLSIAGLAVAARDLTNRARQNKLRLEDVQGGTFTLNNTGALGSTVSQPIINYPQAAILTTEAIQKRPVIRNDAIAIRSMMNVCLSFDHRINDGSDCGAFLAAVKSRLEAIGPDTSIY